MTRTKLMRTPIEGDKIASRVFAHGRFTRQDGREIIVDHAILSHTTGDLCAYDKSRGISVFVVEKSGWSNTDATYAAHHNTDAKHYGTALREWQITARRLEKNTIYNPQGETITFCATGCSSSLVRPYQIEIIGKMQKIFVTPTQSKIHYQYIHTISALAKKWNGLWSALFVWSTHF